MKRLFLLLAASAAVAGTLLFAFPLACGTEVLPEKCTSDADCYEGWGCDPTIMQCRRKCDSSHPCPATFTCDSENLCQKTGDGNVMTGDSDTD